MGLVTIGLEVERQLPVEHCYTPNAGSLAVSSHRIEAGLGPRCRISTGRVRCAEGMVAGVRLVLYRRPENWPSRCCDLLCLSRVATKVTGIRARCSSVTVLDVQALLFKKINDLLPPIICWCPRRHRRASNCRKDCVPQFTDPDRRICPRDKHVVG